MRREIFLDTHGWVALLNKADKDHGEATRIWRRLAEQRATIWLTDWIVAETGNGLARSRGRLTFQEAYRELLATPRLRFVAVRERLLLQALDWYTRFTDKGWGLVDCASFVVMEERGIREALTRDRHFGQAGFRPLLS